MAIASKLKLSIFQHGKALALLGGGHSITSAAAYLKGKYHPGHSLENVTKAYFPRSGIFEISSMAGKPREAIARRFARMITVAKRQIELSSQNIRKLHMDPAFSKASLEGLRRRYANDPELAARRAAIARANLRKYWERPNALAEHLERMRTLLHSSEGRAVSGVRGSAHFQKLWSNPAFREQRVEFARRNFSKLKQTAEFEHLRLKGLRRFWESHRKSQTPGALEPQPGGWEGVTRGGGVSLRGKRIPVYVPEMEGTIDVMRVFRRALRVVPPLQRFIVSHTFGIEAKHRASAVREAKALSKEQWKRELNSAFDTLKQNPMLRKLIEE